MIPETTQWQLIARALLWGLGLGLLYDVLRVFRHAARLAVFWTCLCDIFFWSYTAVSGFRLMHGYGNGLLRWYVTGAALLALWAYMRLISGIFIKAAEGILRPLNKLLTKISGAVKIKTGRSGKRRHEQLGADADTIRGREADDGRADVSEQDQIS